MGLLVRRFHLSVSALLVATIIISHAAKEPALLSWRTFLDEITHGTRVLLREPSLRQALTLSFAEATAGAAAIVATAAYVRDVLGRGDTAFAVVMAGLGLGSTVAALLRAGQRDVMNVVRRPRPFYMVAAIAGRRGHYCSAG